MKLNGPDPVVPTRGRTPGAEAQPILASMTL